MKTLFIAVVCLVIGFFIGAKVGYSIVEKVSINAVQDTLTQTLSGGVSGMGTQAEAQLNQFIEQKKEEMKGSIEAKLKEYFNNKISNLFK